MFGYANTNHWTNTGTIEDDDALRQDNQECENGFPRRSYVKPWCSSLPKLCKCSELVLLVRRRVMLLLVTWLWLVLSVCAMHRPEGVTESELWGRLQRQQAAWPLHTQREGAIEVAVAIPDRA